MTARLKVITDAQTQPKPARKLDAPGAQLWQAVTCEYLIADAGGIELLTQACQALDRAESLKAQINRDGEIIDTPKGPQPHPGLRFELGNRAFITRTLQRLGITDEPIKPRAGRPAGAFRSEW